MSEIKTSPISNVLFRGRDVLSSLPDFKLAGRKKELGEISSILMRMKKRNLVIVGRGGVGVSSMVLGVQECKSDHQTPVEIVGKRLYWLNTDVLFESGNQQAINDLFIRVRQTLGRTKDSILVIEDTVDFIKAAQNNGCTNLINGMMGDLKTGSYQAILEIKDDEIGELLKVDGDIREFCTIFELREPTPENLRLILQSILPALEKHHGVKISPDALEAAASLTERYKLTEFRAQPDAAISLLDQSLTDYCSEAHRSPQHIEALRDRIAAIDAAENGGTVTEEWRNRTPAELIESRKQIVAQIEQAESAWDKLQDEVRILYRDMSDGEDEIRKLDDQIESIRDSQIKRAEQVEAQKALQNGASSKGEQLGSFAAVMANGNMDTSEILEIKAKMKKLEELVQTATQQYRQRVAQIYAGLSIKDKHVLKSFSSLSGIPVDKLNEDERIKLRELDVILGRRVIGQEEPTLEVARAVRRARVGLKMPNKPAGTFMFLGPSGVGKTELAKGLSEALSVPLLRFDMSEYMEKHAVAKLIGAPPGYEGYEHGGILTNSVRRNPYSVVLFDEIEKAHPDVFHLMLQILDDARLTDSRGLVASFKDVIVIMTSNIGTVHFLDEAIDFEQAKEQALHDLREAYRPEFLGRFGGNIYCFKRLGQTVLELIAKKDLLRVNSLIRDTGIHIEMPDGDLSAMVTAQYQAREGARSILGYIDRHITSGIADVVLSENIPSGKIVIRYDLSAGKIVLTPESTKRPTERAAAAQQNAM